MNMKIANITPVEKINKSEYARKYLNLSLYTTWDIWVLHLLFENYYFVMDCHHHLFIYLCYVSFAPERRGPQLEAEFHEITWNLSLY